MIAPILIRVAIFGFTVVVAVKRQRVKRAGSAGQVKSRADSSIGLARPVSCVPVAAGDDGKTLQIVDRIEQDF